MPITEQTIENSASDVSNVSSFDDAKTAALDSSRELSLWLGAIAKFIEPENYTFKESDGKNLAELNWSNELRALRYSLMHAAQLVSQTALKTKTPDIETFAELFRILTQFSILSDRLLAAGSLDLYGWSFFCDSLKNSLDKAALPTKLLLTRRAELPRSLERLTQMTKARQPFGKEVLDTIARLNQLLEILKIVGNKLQKDLPLKNSLLFFSLIYSETKDLIGFIEQRLLGSITPENDFFDLLDGTIYIVSLELKKVYSRELKGVLDLRPAPQLVARVETSHGLLQDCFQQSIILLAEAFDPAIEGWQIFPNYQTRLEHSLILREDLWLALQKVKRAESSPDAAASEKLKKSLEHFRSSSLYFLMFKDCEPTERFIEEILQTKRMQDITHVLHRFGAYLETLLGQVNMRGVLANHPFDYSKIED